MLAALASRITHMGPVGAGQATKAVNQVIVAGIAEAVCEALALAERLGVPAAAKQLGLHASQLYGWREKARAERDQSETERNQATEIARLKRKVAEQAEELAIVKKAAAYFAKSLK